MRLVSIAIMTACLAACGGADSSQGGNSAGGVSNEAQAAPAAAVDLSMFKPVASRDEGMKIHHDRHEGMEAIGKGNKIVKQELNASSPNLALVRATAAKMNQLSKDSSGWFHAGTGMELGKTGAKPEIWQNEADVAAKLIDFQKAMQSFNDTANGTDVGAMKTSFSKLADTCKACHDKYRSNMHH